MDWKLRNHEDFPTYSLHVGSLLLEVYPHGTVIDNGIFDWKSEQPHWQGGIWTLEPGKQPHEGPLDAVKICRNEAGTLAEKQAEVLELVKAWLREQVAAFDALGERDEKPAPVASDERIVCPTCGIPWALCSCEFQP